MDLIVLLRVAQYDPFIMKLATFRGTSRYYDQLLSSATENYRGSHAKLLLRLNTSYTVKGRRNSRGGYNEHYQSNLNSQE